MSSEWKVAHTPGPWQVKLGDTVRSPYRIEGDGWTIANVLWSEHADGDPEANAHLMGAALEMLELLRAMSARGIPGFNAQIRAVIAKACPGALDSEASRHA